MSMEFGARIVLKDNMSQQVVKVRKEVVKLKKDVEDAGKAVKKAGKEKLTVKADAKQAKSEADKVKKKIKEAQDLSKKKMELRATMRDGVSGGLGKIGSGLGKVGGFAMGAVGALAKVGTVAAGVFAALVVGAAKVGSEMVKQGMMLEQQKMSMEHFVGVGNPELNAKQAAAMSAKYMKDLRKNADVTPFETNEVIAAGARTLNAMRGNTAGGMDMLKVAEDMAALNPQKSLMDAVEALADLKNGETERMKEFGFKIDQKQIKKAGGADALINSQIKTFFGGGAAKLSQSASGLMSTITGGFSSGVTDMGAQMLEGLRPLLTRMVPMMERLSPIMGKVGAALGKGLAQVTPIVEILFNKFLTFAEGGGLDGIINGIGNIGKVIAPLVSGFGEAKKMLTPVVSLIWQLVQTLGTGLFSVIQAILPSISQFFGGIGGGGSQILSMVQSVVGFVQTALPPLVSFLLTTLGQVAAFVGPLVEPLMGVFGQIMDWFAANAPGISALIGDIFTTIQPMIQDVITVVGELFTIWVEKVWPRVSEVLQTAWNIIKPVLQSLWDIIMMVWDILKPFISALTDEFGKIWDILKPALDLLGRGFSGLAAVLGDARAALEGKGGGSGSPSGGGGGGGGSHAFGMARVPYNGYHAVLHEGEKVLTKQEVKSGKGQGNNITIAKLADQIVVREDADIDKIATALAMKLSDTALVFGEG